MHHHARPQRRNGRAASLPRLAILRFCCLILATQSTNAIHHMKRKPPIRKLYDRASANTPLIISNLCGETIYPGILTQSGIGPGTGGFELTSGSNKSMTVSENWQGRVWGRSNCSFTGNSGSCGSGDCGGVVSCTGTGQVPTTLAEFTLDAGDGHTYYDLSLVDGYNLPVAIIMLPNANSSFQAIPQNLTNPSCVGTVGDLAAEDFDPYTSGAGVFLGTNASDPLPFETSLSLSDVAQWCPFALQVSTSTGPSGGVYIYPDGSLNRPWFDPCYSACSRYNHPADCCTGAYDSPDACTPSAYSKAAKKVCPDAYSYAFDDQTSTFIIPAGAGFEVVFCPGGRSTNIIATSKNKLVQLAQTGSAIISELDNIRNNLTAFPASENAVSHPRCYADSVQEQSAPNNLTSMDEDDEVNSPDVIEVVTSTVIELAGAATSYPAAAINFINQWQGTGLFSNDTVGSGGASILFCFRPGNFFFVAFVTAGFLLWTAW